MITPSGPDFIALQVRNLEASADYYKNVFGFEVIEQGPPHAVVLKSSTITMALRSPMHPLPDTGPLGVGMVLWVACKDANELQEMIISRGGSIVAPLSDSPFGPFFVAEDPDGYKITFHTG